MTPEPLRGETWEHRGNCTEGSRGQGGFLGGEMCLREKGWAVRML